MTLAQTCILIAWLQSGSAPLTYINLAAVQTELAVRSTQVKGCVAAFDDTRPKPRDFCQPFPLTVNVMSYKPGAGYTKASLVVELANYSKSPVTLPAGVIPKRGGGEVSELTFSVHVEDATESIGFAFAYGDSGDPATKITIQPGERIEYEIPLNLQLLRQALGSHPGTTASVVVSVGFEKLRKLENGDWMSIIDTNPIPSNAFLIRYPN